MKLIWLMASGKLPCLFRLLTGLYCPGCGGTRAVKALLTGQPIISFFYHPVVLYGAAVCIWLVLCRLIWKMTGNRKFQKKMEDRYLYMGIGILAVNFVIKNMLLVVWDVDLLTMLGTM